MKVTYVLGYFPAISETFIVNQINACIDQGHEVTIYSYRKGSKKNTHESHLRHHLINRATYFIKKPESIFNRYKGLFNFVFQERKKLNWKLLFKCLNFFVYGKNAIKLNLFYEAQWFLNDKHHDIIHAHFGHNAQRIARLKNFGFLEKSKLVATFHGFDMVPNMQSHYKVKYDHLFKHANWFTVNTKYLEKTLSPLVPNHIPITILPVGLDTELFQPIQNLKKHQAFTIVFCGRLIKLKGAHIAIKVLKELIEQGHPQVQLRIIGEGSEYDALQVQCADLKLESSVQFLGARSQEEVKRELHQAHLFLLPGINDPETGRAETQGLVIQEAQAMGLPVVVSDAGGMKYGLIDNVTGYVIEQGDINGYVDAIKTLIRDEERSSVMGQKARKFVVENYDITLLNIKLHSIYKEMLSGEQCNKDKK